MTQVSAVPDRSLQQRLDALDRANEIRTYRARVKRCMKDGQIKLVDVLTDEECAGMRIADAMMAVPKIGRRKVDHTLRRVGISPSRTLAGLTERQRRELLERLSRYPSVRVGSWS